MSKTITIKKGLDIKLIGKAEKAYGSIDLPNKFALKPTDFHGVTPKLLVKEGGEVKAGTPVYFDKKNEKVLFTSPVSGKVTEIVRGAKRVIQEIRIESDGKMEAESFSTADPDTLGRDQVIDALLKSGLWPTIRTRPWGRIANPEDKPKAFFISAFDSAPLAPDYNFILEGKEALFQTGIKALKKLTEGTLHLNIPESGNIERTRAFARDVQINKFKGPHPAGNVGVQIHHIDPINKNESVWYCDPQDVINIGVLFSEGRYSAERIFNLTGSQVKERKYHKALRGVCLADYFANNIEGSNNRFISGNVLTGEKIKEHGFLGFYHAQVTVIPEGDYYEFLGWIEPGFKKFTQSRTMASGWFSRNREKLVDTNIHGGERAYFVTGEYEKVFPFDIYPVHLIKAILVQDIDLMEKLGIYEVVPEDMALCEVICSSKINVQEILQNGIDFMINELG